jgi:ubiquinone/menaquinone biosynthesis C-methylase UbiE
LERNSDIKREVQEFYDQYGWQQIGDGLYQNVRYEDTRPVSQEYVRRCRERVKEHIPRSGKFILDAGSGPIQYSEYEQYSQGFKRRVCLDISIQALKEARDRIGDHGLFVVGDMANLPFQNDVFKAVISMHVLYHLPLEEQPLAFTEILRTLEEGGKAVVVYSWGENSSFMRMAELPMSVAKRVLRVYSRLRAHSGEAIEIGDKTLGEQERKLLSKPGLETYKHDDDWLREQVGDLPGFDLRVWRSVSSAFLRMLIHRQFLGRYWLKIIFWLEECFPHFFGRVGQHPMVLFEKSEERTEVKS